LSRVTSLGRERFVGGGFQPIQIQGVMLRAFDMFFDQFFDLGEIYGLGLSDELSLRRRIQLIEKLKDLPLACLIKGLD
jgi:hypothetical protein